MSDQDFRNRFLRLMEDNKNKSQEQLTEEFNDAIIPFVESPFEGTRAIMSGGSMYVR